jgi:hypothetical protein
VPPQHAGDKLADQTFDADELLFRRVAISHIEEGELSLLAISDARFEQNPPSSTSVLRSKYCTDFSDALHRDCNGGKECMDTTVYSLRVGELAKGIQIEPPEKIRTRGWNLYPYHNPLPTCCAHSTICSCEQGALNVPVKPPPSVREQFRVWLRDHLQPCEPLLAAEADSSE